MPNVVYYEQRGWNLMDDINIQTGINYFTAGDKSGALQAFRDVLEKEPNNEIAWMWLAACLNDNNQKRYCFHKILAINPNNSSAQKALAELELQSLGEPKPVPESGTVLKCPSCGSVMGKPDHTGLVQCAYCGTAITYHPPVEQVERRNVEKFFELCNAAFEGSNYDEAIQYANKILEIDPRNVDAWIKKAIATFWLTTGANNRYEEAMGYLIRAEQIDGTNSQIEEAKQSLRTMQSNWFLYLGGQEIDSGNKVYEIYAKQYSVSDSIADGILGSPEAKQQSREYYLKAMNYYLLASQYTPDSRQVLQCIKTLYNSSRWIGWNTRVTDEVTKLYRIEQRENAIARLPELQRKLKVAETDLAKLNKENGLLTGVKIAIAKNTVSSLKEQIAQYERISKSG